MTLDELCEAWETSTDPNDKSVAQPYVLALEAEVERLRDIIQNGIRAVEVDHDSPLASDLRGWLDEARAALVVRGDDL